MNQLNEPPRPARSTLNVDLGELRSRLEERAATDGVRPSAWLKAALTQALAAPGAVTGGLSAVGSESRIRVADAVLAKLDERCNAEGWRSRSDAIASLLAGGGGAAGASVSAAPGGNAGGLGVAEATAVLSVSNYELAGIGRSLSQLARVVKESPGAVDRTALDTALKMLREHVGHASDLLAALAPMVKIRGAERVSK